MKIIFIAFIFLISVLALPSLASARTIIDGDLVKTFDSPDVYIVKIVPATSSGQAIKKFKRLILNPAIFNSYRHFTWNSIIEIDNDTLNDFVLSALVRRDSDPNIHHLSSNANSDNGTKRWIPTENDFTAHGFDRDAVYTINDLEHALYVTGEDYKAEISPVVKNQNAYFDPHDPKNHERLPKTPAVNSKVKEYLAELGWDEAGALAVSQKVRNSTVCILSRATSTSCGATGWVLASDIIATCSHCIYPHHEGEDPTEIRKFFVKTIDGKIFPATPLAQPPQANDGVDLAVAKVTLGKDILPPALPIAPPTAKLGDPVIIAGHPSSMPAGWVVMLGEVEFIGDVDKLNLRSFHMYASDRPGNSGSPIANKNGEVISVLTGSTIRDDGIYGGRTNPYPFELLLNLDETRHKVSTGIYWTPFYDFFRQYAAK